MSHQAPPTAPPPTMPADQTGSEARARGKRVLVDIGVVLTVILIYVLSLVGVHLLTTSTGAPDVDLEANNDTVVKVRLEKLDTVANRLTVNVLVIPEKEKLKDKALAQPITVQLYPENDLGDLQYPVGKTPAQASTVIEAEGDPAIWPFDSYTTGLVQADVILGTGDNRTVEDGRIEVVGAPDGWDVTVKRVPGEYSGTAERPTDVVITLHRSKGTLIFDLGILVVLIALPALALWVSIPMALGKKKFLPPFVSWFAAMLFAVVPLRNILPGSPPPGSWVDQAITMWVVLALIVAMTLFIFAYRRQSD